MASLLIPVTVKVTLILCVAWGATRAMQRRSAAARHLVWSVALMSALVVPVAQATAPRWMIAVLPAATPAAAVSVADEAPTAAVAASRVAATSPGDARPVAQRSAPPQSWLAVFTDIWLAGALCGLLQLVIGVMWAGFISRRATTVTDPAWLASLDAACTSLGLTTPVRLCSSPRTTVPVACGVLRPTVLLPTHAEGWTAERRWVVLIHELAHVRRRDCAMQVLAQAVRALHWFNPAVHAAVARLRTEQELACDDTVLACGTSPASYADHLCEIAEAFGRPVFPLWPMAAMARPSQLEGRVRAILDDDRDRRSPRRRARALAVLTACAAMLPIGALGLSSALPPAVAVVEAAWQPGAAPAAQGGTAPAPVPAPPARPQTATPPAPPAPPATPAAQARQAPVTLSEDTRRRVVDALMTALSDENVDVRRQALFSLAEMREPRAIPSLIKALGDSNNDIRRIAAQTLTEFINTENAETIVPALIPLLKDSDVDVRSSAVRALGRITQQPRRGGPPNPPKVNLHLESLPEAIGHAQAEAERHIERLWNGHSLDLDR
jgi:beta-lactamase regulating signal transducer with metallopeptidase domain